MAGTWTLLIDDNWPGYDSGTLFCWELEITTAVYDCCLPADLQVTKDVDLPAAPVGVDLTYTIEVYNDGPADAANVVVTDVLPPEVAYVSCATTHGVCNDAGDPTIVVDIPTLPVGETAVITIVATIVGAGDAVNTVDALADNVDPNLADNTADVTTAAAAFTHNFYDDWGRSWVCINEFTWDWEWTALDPRIGFFTFGGPGLGSQHTGIMTVHSLQGLPWTMNLKVNTRYHTANGYAQYLAYRVKSGLLDLNTMNDPIVCDVPVVVK
jgi:uncharacterized repeat protein (TIGR01451 family)